MKHIIRKEIIEQRRNYSEIQLQQFSEDIFNKLEGTQVFADSKYILAYYSFPGEVITHSFIEKHAKDKTIILPVVQKDRLILREFKGTEMLEKSAYGILEPIGSEFTDYAKIDLVIVPGMSFDRNLNRLGRGKGYYDKLLPSLKAYLIGVCYSFQIKEEIPVQSHDIQMHCVISQDEIII